MGKDLIERAFGLLIGTGKDPKDLEEDGQTACGIVFAGIRAAWLKPLRQTEHDTGARFS